MFRQDLLEPDHYTGMMARGGPVSPSVSSRKTGDQRVDQILLYGSRDLRMRQHLGVRLREATGLRMQAPQPRHVTLGRPQYSPLKRCGKRLSGEDPAVIFELRRIHCYHAPDEGSGRQLMEPLV